MNFVYDSSIILPLLASFTALISVILAWRHRNASISIAFIVLMGALFWWSFAAIIERITLELTGKIFWMQMTYAGVVIIPIAWLVFILQYTGKEKWITVRNLVFLSIVPVITLIMVWTNNLHHLVWKDIWLNSTWYPPADEVIHNIWFWVFAIYAYCLLILGTGCLFISFRRSTGIYRKQLGVMLLAAFIPWLSNFLFISGVWSFLIIDPTPLAFAFTGIVFLEGLSRFYLLDSLPVARDAIFRSIVDGVIVLDAKYRIVDINPAAHHIIGNGKNNIFGKPYDQVLPEQIAEIDFNSKMNNSVAEIALGEAPVRRYYTVNLSPIITGRRTAGYIIHLHDNTERRQVEEESRKRTILETEISERKRAHQELKQSEHKFKELFNNISSCVAVYESVNNGENFIIKDLNKSAENIEEISKAEVQGKLVTDVFPGVVEMGLLSVLQRVGKTGKPEYIPLKFYKDWRISGWREYYVYKLPAGEIIAAYEDVTIHKQSEDLLNQTLTMFEGVASSSPIGLYIVQEGKIQYVNPRFEAITGFSKEEIIGREAMKYVHDEDKGLVKENARRDLKSEHHHSKKPYQYRIICKSGEIRWILETVASIQYQGNRAILGNFMDITDRRLAEKAFHESEEKYQ